MSKYNCPKDLKVGDKVIVKNCGQHWSACKETMFTQYADLNDSSIIDNKGNGYNMWYLLERI